MPRRKYILYIEWRAQFCWRYREPKIQSALLLPLVSLLLGASKVVSSAFHLSAFFIISQWLAAFASKYLWWWKRTSFNISTFKNHHNGRTHLDPLLLLHLCYFHPDRGNVSFVTLQTFFSAWKNFLVLWPSRRTQILFNTTTSPSKTSSYPYKGSFILVVLKNALYRKQNIAFPIF